MSISKGLKRDNFHFTWFLDNKDLQRWWLFHKDLRSQRANVRQQSHILADNNFSFFVVARRDLADWNNAHEPGASSRLASLGFATGGGETASHPPRPNPFVWLNKQEFTFEVGLFYLWLDPKKELRQTVAENMSLLSSIAYYKDDVMCKHDAVPCSLLSLPGDHVIWCAASRAMVDIMRRCGNTVTWSCAICCAVVLWVLALIYTRVIGRPGCHDVQMASNSGNSKKRHTEKR